MEVLLDKFSNEIEVINEIDPTQLSQLVEIILAFLLQPINSDLFQDNLSNVASLFKYV